MSSESKSGGVEDEKSAFDRLTDSVRSRLTGLNGEQGSEVRSGTVSNIVPGRSGVLEDSRDVHVEADSISSGRVARGAENVTIDAGEVNVSDSVLEDAQNSFISVDKLESSANNSELMGPSIGYSSEGSAASVRNIEEVSISPGMVAFTGEPVPNAATYTGDWDELDREFGQKAVSGELTADKFDIGKAFRGSYSSAEDVNASIDILKGLDSRLGNDNFNLDTEIAESSGNELDKVREEMGKVLAEQTGLDLGKAVETFGRGGNVFLERSDEVRSISEGEGGLELELAGERSFSDLEDFALSVYRLQGPDSYDPTSFTSAENGSISADIVDTNQFLKEASDVSLDVKGTLKSERVLERASGIDLQASSVESRKIGRELSDSSISSSVVRGDRVLKKSEDVELSANRIEADSLGYRSEGLEVVADEISGETRVMWGADDSYLEADSVVADELVGSGTGNEIKVGKALVSGEVLGDDQNVMEAEHLEAGAALKYADRSEIVAEYFEAGEVLNSAEGSKIRAQEAVITEGLFNEYSDSSYLMAEELRLKSKESVASDADYNFNILAAEEILDLEGAPVEEDDLVGRSLGLITGEASESAITYRGEWSELEDVLDSFLFGDDETDMEFIYRQMTDGEYSSSTEIGEVFEIAGEVGALDLGRSQKESILEKAEGSIDVFRDVRGEEYSEEVFSRLDKIENYTEEGWEAFYTQRSDEQLLQDVELLDVVDRFSFSDERKQEIFEGKKERIREIRSQDYGERFFDNIRDIEELTGKNWEEFYTENRDNGIEEEIEMIDRLSSAESKSHGTDTEDVREIRRENEELLKELQGKEWGDYLMRNVNRLHEHEESSLGGMIERFRHGSPDSYRLNPGFQQEYFIDPSGEVIEEPGEAQQKYMEEGRAHIERMQRGAGNFQTPLTQEEVENIIEKVDAEGLVDTEEVVPEEADEYGNAFIQNVNSELGPRIGQLMQEDREKGQELVQVKNTLLEQVGEKRREKAFRDVGLEGQEVSDLSASEMDEIFEGLYEEHLDDSDVKQKTGELASTEGVESVEMELYDNNVEDILIKDRSVPCTFPGSNFEKREGNFVDYMLDPATQVLEVEASTGEAYVVTNLVEFEGDDYLMVHSVESDDGITSRADTSEAIRNGIEEYVADMAWDKYRLDLEESHGEIEGLIYSMDNHNTAAKEFQENALQGREDYEEQEIEVKKKGKTDMVFDVNYSPEAEVTGYVREKEELPKTWMDTDPQVADGIQQVLG